MNSIFSIKETLLGHRKAILSIERVRGREREEGRRATYNPLNDRLIHPTEGTTELRV